MIESIILIIILAIFISVKWGIYKLIEMNYIPIWLNYKPYICEMCFGFWSLTSIFLALVFIVHPLFVVGNVLTILDTVAHYIHIKNNTINSDDYGKME